MTLGLTDLSPVLGDVVVSGSQAMFNLTVAMEGEYSVRILPGAFTDSATMEGSAESNSVVVVLDREPPSVTPLGAIITANMTIELVLQFQDNLSNDVSDFDATDMVVTSVGLPVTSANLSMLHAVGCARVLTVIAGFALEASSDLQRTLTVSFVNEGIYTFILSDGSVSDDAGNVISETVIAAVKFNQDACLLFPCDPGFVCRDVFPGPSSVDGRQCGCHAGFFATIQLCRQRG
jgi:hypothetical protein